MLKKALDPSFSQPTFSLKDNVYGAKRNTSELQTAQPNDALKNAMRLKFMKGTGSLAAGTPSRARMTQNLFQ